MKKMGYRTGRQRKPLFAESKAGSQNEYICKTDRETLIENNLYLASVLAKKYAGRGAEREDLESVGSIGLIKAANNFDPLKNTQFSTYAFQCIKNEILMYLRKSNRIREIAFDENTDVAFEMQEDTIWKKLDGDFAKEKINETAGKLPPRQGEIVRMRFGLNGEPEKTQKNVAAMLKVSQSYVSKVERKFVNILRKNITMDMRTSEKK